MFSKTWIPAHSQQIIRVAGDKKDVFKSVAKADSERNVKEDPDKIDTTEILSRLSHYNEKSYLPLINIHCECFKKSSKPFTDVDTETSPRAERLSDILKDGYDSSSSDDKDADDDLGIDYILDKLDSQRRRVGGAAQHRALVNLIRSYRGQDTIPTKAIEKLIAYLHTDNISMREAGLVLLQQCCNQIRNVQELIKHGVLNDLELIFLSQDCKPVHHVALDSWRKIIENKALKYMWWEPIKSLLPRLCRRMTNEKNVDVRVAILRILKILSNHNEGASLVSEHGMPMLVSLKEKNPDVKECCAEVLRELVCHGGCVKVGNLDNSGVSVGRNLLQQGPCGPQIQALKLLSSISETSGGLTDIVNNNVIPLALSAMNDSKCRKVKLHAAELLCRVLSTRKPGKVKDIVGQVAEYFEVSTGEVHSRTSPRPGTADRQTVYPVKLKTDHPGKLHHVLDKLVKVTIGLICEEANIERNSFGQPLRIGLCPTVDKGTIRLSTLCNSVAILQKICCLPWNKYLHTVSPVQSSHSSALTDDHNTRIILSRVDPQLALSVWDSTGMCLVDILALYSKKFKIQNTQKMEEDTCAQFNSKTKATKLGMPYSEIFTEKEMSLISALLEILLIFAFCTCEKIENPGDNKYEIYMHQSSGAHPESKQKVPSRPKSAKPTLRKSSLEELRLNRSQPVVVPVSSDDYLPEDSPENVECKICESPKTSPRGKHSKRSADKLTRPSSGKANAPPDHLQQIQTRKEADTRRRLMRKSMYEAGVFSAITPFLLSLDVPYKIVALQILRCLVQPVKESLVRPAPDHNAKLGSSPDPVPTDTQSLKSQNRPMSALTLQERNRRLSSAVDRMSPHVAKVIAEALEEKGGPNMPLQLIARPQSAAGKPQAWGTKAYVPGTLDFPKDLAVSTRNLLLPKVDLTKSIAGQCRLHLLSSMQSDLLSGLFSPSRFVKRHTLLLLEDLVQNGDVAFHMKLSEYGCMPKLIDFLRVNEDDELMEITALIVTRMLVTSDLRLRDLFDHHGGSNLLMAMASYTRGVLREEVAFTLKTINTAATKGRPRSAPARTHSDIWEKINQRWRQEDKVSEILQQWSN